MNSVDTDALEAGSLPAPLKDPMGVLRRRWIWMVGTLAVGLVASVAAWLVAVPRYYAEATVIVSRQQVSEKLVQPTLTEDTLNRMDALAAEVLSSANLGALIEELDLYPDLRGSETMSETAARMRADVTLGVQGEVDRRARYAASRVYTIGFESVGRRAAAEVANGIAKLFVESSIEQRHRQHQFTTEFLRRELDSAERDLQVQNRAITAFKQQNRGLLPSDTISKLTRLDALKSQRQELALQIAEAEAQVSIGSPEDPVSLDSQLTLLRVELRALLSASTEKHPDVITLRKQIAAMEEELVRSEAARQEASPTPPVHAADARILEVLRERLAATDAEVAELDDQIERMPAVQEELAALEQKAMILQESYVEFLRKLQDAELAEELLRAQQGERISIMSRAEPPMKPTKRRWRRMAFGIIASFGLAGAIAFALEMLDPVLISADQIEQASSLPVLGSVGRIR